MRQKFLLFCFLSYLFISNNDAQDLKFGKTDNSNPFAINAHLCLRLTDTNNDKLHIRFYGRKMNSVVTTTATAATTTTGKFTIILLPDTQYYTAEPQGTNGGSNTIFKRQTSWIVNNRIKKNIVYIGQLGDCVNDGDEYEVEWKRADTALKKLESPTLTGLPEGIPYGICVGNHDQSPAGSATGTTTFYNKYFGSAHFTGRSYYGGHFSTNNDNFYDLFTVGNINFLVISFEFDPSTTDFAKVGGALDWGESLIKSYPNRNVIVLSHYVLKADGSFSVQGNNIYQRFKVYPNFKFMSGGHIPDSAAEAVRVDTYNGNTVYTVLSNYQGRENGGNGRLRIYEFDPANNNVSVKTYSPYTGTYETDANSQFNMHLSLITNSNPIANSIANSNVIAADTFHLIGELNSVSPGSGTCISWASLEKNTAYEWYAEVFDRKNKMTSSVGLFKTFHLSGLESITELFLTNKEFDKTNVFKVYPNPAGDLLNVEQNGNATFSLLNQLGKILLTTNINNKGSINISRVTAGLYYLKNNSTGAVKKIVIAR